MADGSCIMSAPVAHSIFQLLSHFFAQYGYWAIFFGVMLENAGVPVPGETVLLFAGFLAFQGEMHLGRAIVTGIAGATVGDTVGYCLGRFGGSAFIEKHRRRLGFFAHHFERAQKIYLRHGQWAVFVARFITGLRMFSGILAGSFRMPYPRFIVFDFSGAVIWATTIVSIGFFFGSNWERLIHFVKEFDFIILSIILIGTVVGGIVYYLRDRKSGRSARGS
jgi:membrane protein DedA with SNARE-associated domain